MHGPRIQTLTATLIVSEPSRRLAGFSILIGVAQLFAMVFLGRSSVARAGLFHGFGTKVWLMVFNNAIGGKPLRRHYPYTTANTNANATRGKPRSCSSKNLTLRQTPTPPEVSR